MRGHQSGSGPVGGIGAARDDAAGRARRLERAPGAARGGHVRTTRTAATFITLLGLFLGCYTADAGHYAANPGMTHQQSANEGRNHRRTHLGPCQAAVLLVLNDLNRVF